MLGKSPASLASGFKRPWTMVGLPWTWPPAEVKSALEQSPFSWKCRPCQPGAAPFRSMRASRPLGACVKLADPMTAPAEFFSSIRWLGGESAAIAELVKRVAARAAKAYLIGVGTWVRNETDIWP